MTGAVNRIEKLGEMGKNSAKTRLRVGNRKWLNGD
jgi:hypothetical protein